MAMVVVTVNDVSAEVKARWVAAKVAACEGPAACDMPRFGSCPHCPFNNSDGWEAVAGWVDRFGDWTWRSTEVDFDFNDW